MSGFSRFLFGIWPTWGVLQPADTVFDRSYGSTMNRADAAARQECQTCAKTKHPKSAPITSNNPRLTSLTSSNIQQHPATSSFTMISPYFAHHWNFLASRNLFSHDPASPWRPRWASWNYARPRLRPSALAHWRLFGDFLPRATWGTNVGNHRGSRSRWKNHRHLAFGKISYENQL